MDLTINRRNDLEATIGGLDENGLTGYEGRLVIATEPGSEIILNKPGVITNPLLNKVAFAILPSDLAGATPGSYRCEVDVWKTADPDFVYNPVSERINLKPALGPNPAG
jgi:hypothetical protein